MTPSCLLLPWRPQEAAATAFVRVAGGLGERLGYSGIKVALPVESASGASFLQHYIESILALQVGGPWDSGRVGPSMEAVWALVDGSNGSGSEFVALRPACCTQMHPALTQQGHACHSLAGASCPRAGQSRHLTCPARTAAASGHHDV